MNQEISELIAAILPTTAIIALVVVVVAAIFAARKLLPDEYRWETVFRDLLVNNLGDRK
jgi:hypothetical protein